MMEDIFDKYNALIQEMADAVAEAKDEKEAEKIQSKYDKEVEEADKILETELQEAVKKADEELAKEQAESEKEFQDNGDSDNTSDDDKESEEDKEIKDNKRPFLDEFEKYLKKGEDAKGIAKRFKEAELIEIGGYFDLEWTTRGSKVDKVEAIISLIEEKKFK